MDARTQTNRVARNWTVMEKTSNATAVLMKNRWGDLGTWSSIYDHLEKDQDGNVATSFTTCIDSHGNLVWSDSGKAVLLLGLDNLIIVDSVDGLLVADKKVEVEVEQVPPSVESRNISAIGVESATSWGYYKVLERKTDLLIKTLHVLPSQHLISLKHEEMSRTWTVASGECEIIKDGARTKHFLRETVKIEKGEVCTLVNHTKDELVILEMQVGKILDSNPG